MVEERDPRIDVHYTAGIRVDCDKLIERFIKTDSLRYQEFCQIWKEMKMSLVFCGREDFREIQEFTEIVLNMAKNLWLSPEDIHLQVAGFYLLYSLYLKQPFKSETPIKIRMTLNEWKKCTTFVTFLNENEHWDTYYIFYKLVEDNAFHFVHMPLEIFPGTYTDSAEEELKFSNPYHEDHLENFLNDHIFQLLESQHDTYEAMKDEILQQKLSLTDTELIKSIKGLINDDDNTTASGSSGAAKRKKSISDIGQRRQKLKARLLTGNGS